jgi:hypothetical protein
MPEGSWCNYSKHVGRMNCTKCHMCFPLNNQQYLKVISGVILSMQFIVLMTVPGITDFLLHIKNIQGSTLNLPRTFNASPDVC